jgi:hypothetical protein
VLKESCITFFTNSFEKLVKANFMLELEVGKLYEPFSCD